MDGATNMNVSNAPSAITAGEAKKLKKSISKDAAAAEKLVSHVGKSLRSAEKDESKAEKAAHRAQRAREKAVQEEHKTAQVLSEAQHHHDLAVAGENKAANDLSMRQKHLEEAHQTVETWRSELEQAQQRKDAGNVRRPHFCPALSTTVYVWSSFVWVERQKCLQQTRQVADTSRITGPSGS